MSRIQKIMMHQFAFANKSNHPNLLVVMDEENIMTWYFKVINLPEPYLDGEFIFKLEAEESFPKTPPIFSFLTPNGVFEPGGKVCISIGEFHKSDHGGDGSYGWRPALGMIGFAREVVNGLVVPDYLNEGVRIIKTTESEKIKLAKESAEFNEKNYSDLEALFEQIEHDNPGLDAVKSKNFRTSLKSDHQQWLEGKIGASEIAKKYLPEPIFRIVEPILEKSESTKANLTMLLMSKDFMKQKLIANNWLLHCP